MNKFWHWPDHIIRKRESRRLREEHNNLANSHQELLDALNQTSSQLQTYRSTGHMIGWDLALSDAASAIKKAKELYD